MALQAIQSTSIRHPVADAIRAALRDGTLKPGEDLNEVELASQFKVSRGPVREALLVLAEEGLLSHSANLGFSVVHLTQQDHDNIDEIRILLETRALERARKKVMPADLVKIEEMKTELLGLFHDAHHPSRDAWEIAFHSFIWELSGNPWLVTSLKRIMIPFFTFGRHVGLTQSDRDPKLAEEQHQLYLDYLAGRTTRTAEECVRFHVHPHSAAGSNGPIDQ
jgi:DNA-binding GntR family transcriptional regulator